MRQALDGLIATLVVLIGFLLLTGGFHYVSPHAKLELSEIDAFAWVLLALLAIRRRALGEWLPLWLEKGAQRALAAVEARPAVVVGLAIIGYVVVHVWLSAWRFDSLHANAFDLGYVDQSLWSTTRVGFLHSTLSKGQTYLGEHFAPALGAVALIYRAWDSIYALFMFQSLVLASGAVLVYVLARAKGIERGFAALLALCLLAYHPLRAANTFDFREDDLFVPVFLGVLLAVEQRRWWLFWLLAVVSWTIKENAPIFTALIGLWLALSRRRPRSERLAGLTLFALSVPFFLIINTKVTPYFAGGAAKTMAVTRLGRFGKSGTDILRFMVLHPFAFAAEAARPIFQKQALRYFLNVTVPFIVFAPAAPLVFVIVLLGIMMNLLVNLPTIGFHYECILIPFLFYVLVSGIARLAPARRNATAGFFLGLSFLLFFGRSPIDTLRRSVPSAHDRMVAGALATIPADASVAAMPVLQPHLTHRRDAYLFSDTHDADYVVVDLSPGIDRYAAQHVESDLAKIDGKTYARVFDRDGFLILKRKAE